MKSLLLIITLLSFAVSFGQEAKIIPKKPATLKDASTNCTYVLDASHKYIRAYDSKKKLLWTFSTTISNYCEDCGLIEISSMKFTKNVTSKARKGEKVIYITHAICWGEIRLSDGSYFWQGCD